MALDPITAGLDFATNIVRRIWPDPEDRQKGELAVLQLAQSGELAKMQAQSSIIVAEANSEHVITATWRPIVMLTFTALVVAHFLGLTAENIDEAQIEGLLNIVQYGLTGYILGRSSEKVVKEWKKNDSKD
jgi:hypothetical protein